MNSTICYWRAAMGTLTEEIFTRRLGRPVHAGEIVVAPVDYAMAHDVTGPLAIEAFRQLEVPIWDPDRVTGRGHGVRRQAVSADDDSAIPPPSASTDLPTRPPPRRPRAP